MQSLPPVSLGVHRADVEPVLAVGSGIVSVVANVSFTSSGTKSVTGENAYE